MATMSRTEILGKVYKMIPPMLEKFHKGEHETYRSDHDGHADMFD